MDLGGGGDDPAIRGRAPADSNLIARKLEDAELVLVASPAYLARAGKPRSPAPPQACGVQCRDDGTTA